MNQSATFTLPACPICSSVFHLERPYWRLGRHLESVAKIRKHALVGCSHANEVGKLRLVDAEDRELVESAWNHFCQEAFTAKTAEWAELPRKRFREILDDKRRIAGLTELIDFSPAPAGSTQNEKKEQHAS